MTSHFLNVETPIGLLSLSEENGYIIGLDWEAADEVRPTTVLALGARQLTEYFEGQRTEFDLPLTPPGTRFQQSVWYQMGRIPYGETRSYGALAKIIHSSARAVGTACGRNPIPIIIPCHRVVGANGSLTGYSGGKGIETKKFLIDLEARGAA